MSRARGLAARGRARNSLMTGRSLRGGQEGHTGVAATGMGRAPHRTCLLLGNLRVQGGTQLRGEGVWQEQRERVVLGAKGVCRNLAAQGERGPR